MVGSADLLLKPVLPRNRLSNGTGALAAYAFDPGTISLAAVKAAGLRDCVWKDLQMRGRRSAGERTRARIGAWMPVDGRTAALLGVLAIVAMIFASFLH
jgi:hypothetical protein